MPKKKDDNTVPFKLDSMTFIRLLAEAVEKDWTIDDMRQACIEQMPQEKPEPGKTRAELKNSQIYSKKSYYAGQKDGWEIKFKPKTRPGKAKSKELVEAERALYERLKKFTGRTEKQARVVIPKGD